MSSYKDDFHSERLTTEIGMFSVPRNIKSNCKRERSPSTELLLRKEEGDAGVGRGEGAATDERGQEARNDLSCAFEGERAQLTRLKHIAAHRRSHD